jgi:outer membrane protein assembly factor BamB
MDRNGNLYLGTQGGLVKMDYNGNLIGSTPTASPVWSSPVVDWTANKVYFADIIGNLFAFGYGNRRITNNSIYSAPVIKDNNIYVVDLAGDVLRVTPDLNSSQKLVSLQREVRSSPAVLGNKLFVASVDGRVCAVDLATGTKLWDKPFNDEKFYGGFAIDVNGNLYIAGKRLWCLKSSDGSVNWSYELDGQAYANPVISSNGVIYIGDTSGTFGTLHAVDLNGSRRWKKTELRSIVSSAVIGNNGIVYVCSDWIHAINPYDGSIISSLELQNLVESNPILHFGKIYVADEAGYFYVIRALSETIEDPGTSWPMFQRDWYHTATR